MAQARVWAWGFTLAGLVLLAGAVEAKEPPPPIVLAAQGESVLRGRVLSEAGEPVASAEVRAYRDADLIRAGADLAGAAEPAVLAGRGQATSGAQGEFQIGGLATGVYVLRVAAPGQGLAVVRGVVATSGGGPATDVVLPAATAVDGDVVDGTGKGVPDVAVCARIVVDDDAHPEHPVAARVLGRTDAGGRFRIEGVPLRADGAAVSRLLLTARAGAGPLAAVRIVVAPWTGRARLVLAGDAVLAGTVRDVRTQAPVPGAHVEVLLAGEGDPGRSVVGVATTGADGTWRLDGLPAGPVQFVAVAAAHLGAAGGAPATPVVARNGESASLATDLDRGRGIAGEVYGGPKGARIQGVEILAWRRSAAFVAEATTGPDGKYSIDGLPGDAPGEAAPAAVLVVGAPGWVPIDGRDFSIHATGRSGPVLHGSFRLRSAATVTGRVLDGAGTPVPDAVLSFERASTRHAMPGPWPYVVRAGADGTFVAPDLIPDVYRITATSPRLKGPAEALVRAETEGATFAGVEVKAAAVGSPPPPAGR